MIPTPTAVGLILCDYFLVEDGTNKVSFIGCFRDLTVETFPAVLPPFFVCTSLTDGAGTGIMELTLSNLETGEEVFAFRWPITFQDPLTVLRVRVRVRNWSISAPGTYQVMLSVDGDLVGQRQLHVYRKGGSQ
jgi:hypothetical protein